MPTSSQVFPENINFEPVGGPEFVTDVARKPFSGREQRNQVRQAAYMRWRCGLDDRDIDDVATAIAFFRARRGRLQSFLFKDWSDFKAGPPGTPSGFNDMQFGTGDGTTTDFQLTKSYISGADTQVRTISRPKSGTIRIAVDGVELTEGVGWTLDYTTGLVTFSSPPGNTLPITWGGEFYAVVRFDNDLQEVEVRNFQHGSWPSLEIVEVEPD